jgi:hypothetical protein
MNILIGLAIAFSIPPTFKIGDCLSLKSLEYWERDHYYKVTDLGRNKYKVDRIGNRPSVVMSIPYSLQEFYVKTECKIYTR